MELVQRLDLSLSPQSWDNLTMVHPNGRLESATGRLDPHVLLKIHRSAFTSVCLVLRKGPASAPQPT
jgi:hypothetical protein